MKAQEECKQLGYKVKELEDQVVIKDALAKQKCDEVNYWKSQADGVKHDVNALKLSYEKKNDEYNLLYGDFQIVSKQRDNKNYLL